MDTLLIVDCETTGTDDAAHAIEVAGGLYSIRHRTITCTFSSLLRGETNEAADVNGIPPAALQAARGADAVHGAIRKMRGEADAFAGWNVEFDRRFFPEDVQRVDPWVDLMDDVAWPRRSTSKSLVATVLAHGIGVGRCHRALDDVLLCAELLSRAAELGLDIDAALTRALRPKALFEVADRRFDEARNARAKELGFRWDQATKSWRRRLFVDDAPALPFEVRRVEAA